MLRRFFNWLNRPVGRRPPYRRRRGRPVGCLLWLLILVGILVIVSLFFGSFQKGTRASGSPSSRPAVMTTVVTCASHAAGSPSGPLIWTTSVRAGRAQVRGPRRTTTLPDVVHAATGTGAGGQ